MKLNHFSQVQAIIVVLKLEVKELQKTHDATVQVLMSEKELLAWELEESIGITHNFEDVPCYQMECLNKIKKGL